MDKITPKKNDIVRKSEALVQARYQLNPIALKFITALIAGIKPSDTLDKEYVFDVRSFGDLVGAEYAALYTEIELAVDELLKKPLHIPTETGWIKANWIADAEYKKGEGYVSFTIPPRLRPYLLALREKFLQYKLENILPLRSTYSIRLYEILKDWLQTQNRYGKSKKVEKIVSLSELRAMLQIPRSYQWSNSSGIKRRILKRAQDELAKHTDIAFNFEEIKTGRRVTHLKFIIEENQQKVSQDPENVDFLKNKRAFVAYLRKHYVNRPIIEAPNKNADHELSKWAIAPNGNIYDMRAREENITASRSDEIYENLYNYALNNPKFAKMLAEKRAWGEY